MGRARAGRGGGGGGHWNIGCGGEFDHDIMISPTERKKEEVKLRESRCRVPEENIKIKDSHLCNLSYMYTLTLRCSDASCDLHSQKSCCHVILT